MAYHRDRRIDQLERAPTAAVVDPDDDAMVARSIARMLDGHDVTIAENGEEALALSEQGAFDVILCDLIMPRMSGLELLKRICALGKQLEERVVFMSGARLPDHDEALAELPNRVLEKPIDPHELDEVLSERIDGQTGLSAG